MNREKLLDELSTIGWTIAAVITVAAICMAGYALLVFGSQVANAITVVNSQGACPK